MSTTPPTVPQPTYYPDAPPPPTADEGSPQGSGPSYGYSYVPVAPPPPNSPLEVQQYPYTVWAFKEVIVGDPGLAANAVQGPPGTPQDIIRVHGGKAEKVIAFVARRYGANPQVPSRVPGVANDVPAPWVLTRSLVGFLTDGTPCIEICGVYKYFLRVPPAESDPSNLAAPPYTNLTPSDYTTEADVFSEDIYEAVQPGDAPSTPVNF